MKLIEIYDVDYWLIDAHCTLHTEHTGSSKCVEHSNKIDNNKIIRLKSHKVSVQRWTMYDAQFIPLLFAHRSMFEYDLITYLFDFLIVLTQLESQTQSGKG